MTSCLLLLFVTSMDQAHAYSATESMVKVTGTTSIGSGFVVGFDSNGTYIVTAAHVIDESPQPLVRFGASPLHQYRARVIQVDSTLDIAALVVNGSVRGVKPLFFDQRFVEPADPLQVLGYPGDHLNPVWGAGIAATVDGSEIMLDSSFSRGHSGGPLLRNGWAVGLMKESRADYSFAVPATFVQQVLSRWRVPTKVGTSARQIPRQPEEPADSEPEIDTDSSFDAFGSLGACTATVVSSTGASQQVQVLADRQSQAYHSLQPGTRVTVLSKRANGGFTWIQVRSSQGTGWMRKEHLRVSPGCSR